MFEWPPQIFINAVPGSWSLETCKSSFILARPSLNKKLLLCGSSSSCLIPISALRDCLILSCALEQIFVKSIPGHLTLMRRIITALDISSSLMATDGWRVPGYLWPVLCVTPAFQSCVFCLVQNVWIVRGMCFLFFFFYWTFGIWVVNRFF